MKVSRATRFATPCAIVILLSTRLGLAAELGQTLQLSTTLSNDSSGVDLAYNSQDGQYLAVWSISDSNARNVAGQRFTHAGNPVGNNLRLMIGTGVETDPQVAYNPVNNMYFLTARVQESPLAVNHGAIGKLVTSSGLAIGGGSIISNAGLEPELVYNAIANEFYFTGRQFDPSIGIFGRRIASSGTPVGLAQQVDPGDSRVPNGDLIWNSVENEYLGVWRRQGDGRGFAIATEARRIGVDGVPLAPAETVPLPPSTGPVIVGVAPYTWMEAAFDPLENRYLLAYNRSNAVTGTSVLGRFVDAAGIPMGPEILLSEQVDANFSLEFDPVQRRYLLAGVRDSTRLVGRSFDASAALIGEFDIAATGGRMVSSTVLFNDAEQEFMVAWIARTGQGTQHAFARAVFVPEPAAATVLFSAIGAAALHRRTRNLRRTSRTFSDR